MPIFAAGIFLGSFLLFQVQLMLGKYLLPWFGGSPAVWNACLLFFQTMLLVGYAYAHRLTALPRRHQLAVHLPLLALSLLLLPVAPAPPAPSWLHMSPVLQICLLLAKTIGVPYLLLAASAPLLQHWYVRRFPDHAPWRLYALSNGASLLALVSYPFVVEPQVALSNQGVLWGWCYALYALLCAACALAAPSRQAVDVTAGDTQPEQGDGKQPLPWLDRFLWFALAACGSATLLAVTNKLCQEVAAVPFLWMLPLALYLATFVACFANAGLYRPPAWAAIFFGIVACVQWLMLGKPLFGLNEIYAHLLLLVASCMVCHGELMRLRPGNGQLTAYYLSIAAGGALGTAFVTLAAPLLFTGIVELPLAMTGVCAALLARHLPLRSGGRWQAGPVLLALGLAAQLVFTVAYITRVQPPGLARSRSFFGTLLVTEGESMAGPFRSLINGTTLHGKQYLHQENRSFPTSYYGAETGVGLALRLFPPQLSPADGIRNKKVGVIGLGIGTVACYGVPGDVYRFYEINPDVIRYARQYFTFLADSSARVEIVQDDARLALARELAKGERQEFDILVVDAFTSDNVPVHLLTREAVSLYLRHLKPDGLLLFNITNRYLNLAPVLNGHATALGLTARFIATEKDALTREEALWGVLTRNERFLAQEEVRSAPPFDEARSTDWTDNSAGLFEVLN